MKQLVLVDFMYTMHRHMYMVKNQEKRNGGLPIMTHPTTGEESARLYFAIKDIEAILQRHPEADIVVCQDRPSFRKESEGTDYKANRSPDRFDAADKAAITNTANLLCEAGVSVIYGDGLEADDIINSILKKYKNKYDEILIYTPDSDLAVLIDDKTKLMRYKSTYSKNGVNNTGSHATFIEAHALVTTQNFEDYFSDELSKKGPVTIDYNSLMFFKTTVGDTSDHIAGIKGFGNSAYTKLRNSLISAGHKNKLKELYTADAVYQFLNTTCREYLTQAQLEQAVEALNYIKPCYVNIPETVLKPASSLEIRRKIYDEKWYIKSI